MNVAFLKERLAVLWVGGAMSERGAALKERLFFFASILLLLVALFLPTTSVELSQFHNDDVRLIDDIKTSIGGTGALSFVFSTKYEKFRPITNAVQLAEYYAFGANYRAYIFFNLILLSVICFVAWRIFLARGCSGTISLLLSLSLVTCKFVYYGIFNILGSFELWSLMLAMMVIERVYRSGYKFTFFTYALTCATVLSDERYLPLLILPVVCEWFFAGWQSVSFVRAAKVSLSVLAAYFALKVYVLGMPFLVGTGGTRLSDTFSVESFFSNYIKATLEVVGWSNGPIYLTGQDFLMTASNFSSKPLLFALIVGNAILLGYVVFRALRFRDVDSTKELKFRGESENDILLFLAAVFFATAAVTFRLELRWISMSYFLLLLLAATLFGRGVISKRVIYLLGGCQLAYNAVYFKMAASVLYFSTFANVRLLLGK